MKLVIDIEDAVLDCVIDRYADGEMPDDKSVFDMALYAIANGTALPRGHGDLKDYDAIKSEYIRKMSIFMSEEERMDLLCTIIDEAEAVIEADREGQDESD